MPTIAVTDKVQGELKQRKIHPRESYNDVIERVLSNAVKPGKDQQ